MLGGVPLVSLGQPCIVLLIPLLAGQHERGKGPQP